MLIIVNDLRAKTRTLTTTKKTHQIFKCHWQYTNKNRKEKKRNASQLKEGKMLL